MLHEFETVRKPVNVTTLLVLHTANLCLMQKYSEAACFLEEKCPISMILYFCIRKNINMI